MFRKIETERVASEIVAIDFEGTRIEARAGISVAAALLAEGVASFRKTPVRGLDRGPYCMMGVCFDCLLEIDGRANSQGCMIEVRDGMKVSRQEGRMQR